MVHRSSARGSKIFLLKDGIEYIFTAPYHPSSLKRVIRKEILDSISINETLQTFLLYYRNTKHTSTGPALLLANRRLHTRLDASKPDRQDKIRLAQKRQVDAAGGTKGRNIQVGVDVCYRTDDDDFKY